MASRLVLALVVSMLAFGAAEAQAGTVFKMCWDSPVPPTYSVGCSDTFVADAGQRNVVQLETSFERDRFREPGRLIRSIGPGYDFNGPDAGEPNFLQTAADCTYLGDSAQCKVIGPEGPFVYLGDLDDRLTIADNDGWSPRVYGEGGNDVVESSGGLIFIGGHGGDDFIAPRGILLYPAEPGAKKAAMHFDWDGVADDGRPGEGDNVRPGIGLAIDFAGDHVVTGNDRDNIAHAAAGDQTMDGFGGDDHLSGGPGDDRLDGGAGDDNLSGHEGADVLTGGLGTDNFHGGDGDDSLWADDGVSEQVHCDGGNDVAHVDAADFPMDCETIVIGG